MEANKRLKIELTQILKLLSICTVVFLVLELSLFNIKFWTTFRNKEIDAFDYLVEIGAGLVEENKTSYLVKDSRTAYFLFRGFDEHITNIFIDILYSDSKKVNFFIDMDDAANDNEYGMHCEETTLFTKYIFSKHFSLHTNGNSHWLKLHFTGNLEELDISAIKLNPKVPFRFSFIRLSLLVLISLFVLIFRPHGYIYECNLFSISKKGYLFIFVLTAICMLNSVILGNIIKPGVSIKYVVEHGWPAHAQYTELANALISGHVSLLRSPPKSLENAKNPYDGRQRWEAVVTQGKETFEYDYAYFKGKYYSYFGVVPAVLFFVPYKLITGHDLHTWHIVTMLAIVFCIVSFWFVYELCRKYFKIVSLGTYSLASLFMIFASSVIYLVYVGNTYSLPIISALVFGLSGLSFWLRCCQNNNICKWQLVFGSLCIALVLGCRPHLVLVFILAVPIFWTETIEMRLFFSKKGVVNTVLIMLPFVLIGVFLAVYNYARFGSPFDFGANYNLTANDMTHRGWDWARIPLAFFTYFLQPFSVSARFPFIECNRWANNYLGYTYYEPIFGGMIWYNFLIFVNLFIPRFRNILKQKNILLLPIFLISLGIFIMAMDANVAGLTQRYASDFYWLFAISTTIVVFLLEEYFSSNFSSSIIYIAREGLLIGGLASLILNEWSIFIIGRYFSMIDVRPSLFFYVRDLILFY